MEKYRLSAPDVVRLYLNQDVTEGNQRSVSLCFIYAFSLNSINVPVVLQSMSAVQVKAAVELIKKVRFTLEQTMNAQRGRCIVLALL
jgi:hypothetical protein